MALGRQYVEVADGGREAQRARQRKEFGRVKYGCLAPVRRPDGNLYSCRKCKNCLDARRDGWVGRILAETRTSSWVGFVTLTYGLTDRIASSEGEAQRLCYPEVQEYLRRLRHCCDGPVRYFCAGERGPETGRAHWHLLVFLKGKPPPNVLLGERYIHMAETAEQAKERGSRYKHGKALWPHGWSFWEEAHFGSALYVTKYLTKLAVAQEVEAGWIGSEWNELGPFAARERTQMVFGLSRRPVLGAEWLSSDWALAHVEAGLSPQELRYEFRDIVWKDGKPRKFYMRGEAVSREFLSGFVWGWRRLHGNDNWPASKIVDEYMEKEELRRFRRRHGLPDIADYLFDERFFMERYNKPGKFGPLLRDGGYSYRHTYFPQNYAD